QLVRIRQYLQDNVRKQIIEYWNRAEFAFDMLTGLAAPGPGELAVQDWSWLYRGLVCAEVARVDAALCSLVGILEELIAGRIGQLGSDTQRQRWLDQLCNFQAIGSFAMTEPNHGSDIAGGMETTATKIAVGWVINGHKR